jgi:DNA (cytosine-5)-methyltransferase 1
MLMRMLDLYCGEGLAAWGYWRSGRFHTIVGIDNNPIMRSRYSFDFLCGDALALDYEFLSQFDFVHASPPCQAYSKMTPDRSKHPRLIAATHLMLVAAGKPYVIENVEGSGQELKPNLRLYGRDVGLNMDRPRYFHISGLPGDHQMSIDEKINLSTGAKVNVSSAVHIHGGQYVSRDKLIEVFGLDTIPLARRRLLTRDGIEQGIPPAFTQLIAEMIFSEKALIA